MPSGRVRISRYSRAAATRASAIPVLPLVGSTITERPRSISPSRSAASTIATPIRSLTEPPGLKNSSFATTSPGRSAASRGSATSVVLPTTAELSAPTRSVVVVVPLDPAIRTNYRNRVRYPVIRWRSGLGQLLARPFVRLRTVVAEQWHRIPENREDEARGDAADDRQ